MKTVHQEETTEGLNANTSVSHPNTSQISSERQRGSFSEWSDKKVGGCWIKSNRKGDSYLSGRAKLSQEVLKKLIENGGDLNFHIYKNTFQEGNQPSYNFYIL
jgi:hypothetical protein